MINNEVTLSRKNCKINTSQLTFRWLVVDNYKKMAGTKKTDTEVVKVEPEITKTPNLFGASEGENFLAKTLGQNFSQVKKTLIEYKTEDIKREMHENQY